ncbi:MAG: hypothetical protein KA957_10915 [Syntrophaceae bacterium]|nr:hypothetical protein [Syntrophaceae bacterium]
MSRKMPAVLFIFCLIALTGCAGPSSFGKFLPDDQARKVFETFEVSPDYRYYVSGSYTYPTALLALKKSYSMGNDLWTEATLSPDSMREMIVNMQHNMRNCCQSSHHGFVVYDQRNNAIGIMYTYVGLGVLFKVTDDNMVQIYGPRDDDQLKRYQGRTLK